MSNHWSVETNQTWHHPSCSSLLLLSPAPPPQHRLIRRLPCLEVNLPTSALDPFLPSPPSLSSDVHPSPAPASKGHLSLSRKLTLTLTHSLTLIFSLRPLPSLRPRCPQSRPVPSSSSSPTIPLLPWLSPHSHHYSPLKLGHTTTTMSLTSGPIHSNSRCRTRSPRFSPTHTYSPLGFPYRSFPSLSCIIL